MLFRSYTAEEIAEELVSLNRNKADWPKQTETQWLGIIANAVSDGRLARSSAGIITLPVPVRVETVKQLELF